MGQRVQIGAHELMVAEKKAARFVSAEGELPFRLRPGDGFRYVDLRGAGSAFGTLDFGDGESVQGIFLGKRVEYAALFEKSALRDVAPAQADLAVGLNCPNCGAGMELKAPDETRRVTCGTCDALLDVERGSPLRLLESAMPRIPDPTIPLGARGELDGERFVVYGQLVKRTAAYGEIYRWTEYLLRSEGLGWAWLVESDGHFSLVRPADPGAVAVRGRTARYEGRSYTRYSGCSAEVEGLRGEFYWKVAVGDVVSATDYVSPPRILSEERTAEEVNFAEGRYLDRRELQAGFGKRLELPRAPGIAPHQPNPFRKALGRMAKVATVVMALLMAMAGARWMMADETEVLVSEHRFAPSKRKSSDKMLTQGEPIGPLRFEVAEGRNLAVEIASDVSRGALFVLAELSNPDVGDHRVFGVTVEQYGDPAEGGGWVAGARRRIVFQGGVAPGHFILTLRPQWVGGPKDIPKRIRVRVVSDVFVGTHAMIAAGLAWLLPLVGVFRAFGFEKRRWADAEAGWE